MTHFSPINARGNKTPEKFVNGIGIVKRQVLQLPGFNSNCGNGLQLPQINSSLIRHFGNRGHQFKNVSIRNCLTMNIVKEISAQFTKLSVVIEIIKMDTIAKYNKTKFCLDD